eukprot:895438-Prymnesium_polylepis.1
MADILARLLDVSSSVPHIPTYAQRTVQCLQRLLAPDAWRHEPRDQSGSSERWRLMGNPRRLVRGRTRRPSARRRCAS